MNSCGWVVLVMYCDGFDICYQSIYWRREWLPTPVFLPAKSPGQRSLAGYSPNGCKESDTAEPLSMHTPGKLVSNQLSRATVTLLAFLGLLIGRASGTSLCLPPRCFRGYVISLAPTALIEPLDWRVDGELGLRAPTPTSTLRFMAAQKRKGRHRRASHLPSLKKGTKVGVFQKMPHWASPVQAKDGIRGQGSERLPCSPRSREGRGRAGVLLRQGGAQAGSVPCRTISPNTPLLLNADKRQVSECSWSKSEIIWSLLLLLSRFSRVRLCATP